MLSRVIINTFFLTLTNYVGMLVNGVLIIALARYLGAYDLGVYTTVFAFIFFGGLVSNFGLPSIVVRDVAKDNLLAPSYFINGLFIMISLGIVTWLVISGVVFFIDYPAKTRLLIVLGCCSLVTGAISNLSSAIFRAFEKMETPSLVASATAILNSVAGIAMLWLGLGLYHLIVLMVITGCINAVIMLAFVRRYVSNSIKKINPKLCVSLLNQAFPLALIMALNTITRRVDILMLSAMQGLTPVGLYSVAAKYINFISVPTESFAGALLPRMSSNAGISADVSGKTYEKSVSIYMLVCLPVAVISFVYAGEIINLVFGKEYALGGSATALKILICSFLFNIASGPAGIVILSFEDRLKKFVSFAAAISVLNIILNAVFIPRYGFLGAGFSTVICSVLGLIIKLYLIGPILQRRYNLFALSQKPLMASAFMIGTVLFLKTYGSLLSGMAGIGIYIAILYFLGMFKNWGVLKRKRVKL